MESVQYQYLVTTDKTAMPTHGQIVMVDGTVPGWSPKGGDLHFDHHKPGGAEIQLWEIPDGVRISDNATFVTTQVDADACAAVAWIRLLQLPLDGVQLYEAKAHLSAIAYDCDHLGLPLGEEWDPYRESAKNAVASLKLEGDQAIKDLGLPLDRKTWDATTKQRYASECFKRGTDWLFEAALGDRPWPGEQGEASEYWARVEAMRPYVEMCSYMQDRVAVLDQRSLSKYCDPRLLVEWARQQPDHSNITLTIRDRSLRLLHTEEEFHPLPKDWSKEDDSEHSYAVEIPAYSYTLGSIPLHKDGCPNFSDRGVWQKLADFERQKRARMGYPAPSSDWGGRNAVGGSSWNDACILSPQEVIAISRMKDVVFEWVPVENTDPLYWAKKVVEDKKA